MKPLLLAIFLVCTANFLWAEVSSPNELVANSRFEAGTQGWATLWTRIANSAKAEVMKGAEGSYLSIVSTGEADWSFAQNKTVSVKPGEVYFLAVTGQWNSGPGSAEASVVLRGKNDQVLDWSYAPVKLDGQSRSRKLVVPSQVLTIQVRLIGAGLGSCTWSQVSLTKVNDAPERSAKTSLELKKNGVQVSPDFANDRLKVVDPFGHVWLWGLADDGAFLQNGYLESASDGKQKIVLKGLDANGADLTVSIDVDPNKSVQFIIHEEHEIAASGSEPLGIVPGKLVAPETASWVLPLNEGLLVPANDPNFHEDRLSLFSGHGLCMPWFGLVRNNDGAGILIRCETPDDAEFVFKSGCGISWLPQKRSFGYDRKLVVSFSPSGGYVALAKLYQNLLKTEGRWISLKEKIKSVPALEKLAGAIDLWWFDDAPRWSNDQHPEKAAQELKSEGIDRVLWSNGSLSAESSRAISSLGFVVGKYDNVQDVYDPAKASKVPWLDTVGWPTGLVLDETGKPRKGWVTHLPEGDLVGGILNSAEGLRKLQDRVPKEVAAIGYQARFLDTTTAARLYEDYSPQHAQTRTDDKKAKQTLLAYLSGTTKLVTGSETGIDWAAPYVHYFEGMMSLGPYRLPDSGYDLTSPKTPTEDFKRFQIGTDYRIPLFELVYHGSVFDTWYWGDSSNRVPEFWDDRDLFNGLYGTLPLWVLDHQTWNQNKARFVKSFATLSPILRASAWQEMTSHEFVTSDHLIQKSVFETGLIVWVNFGNSDWRMQDGSLLKAKSLRLVTK